MKKTSRLWVLSAVVLAVAGYSAPAGAEESCTGSEVVEALEQIFRSDGQVAQMEMRVVRPRTTRTMRMRFWFVKGGRGAEDRALARVEAPAAERGVASLRLGNKMWSFVPSTGRVQQVPESMMLGSWMGSDVTNDDMVRESSWQDDYQVNSCKIIDHDGTPAYEVDLRARKGREVTWTKVVTTAYRGGENDMMPISQEFFSSRAGELVLARTMSFADYGMIGDRRFPRRMTLQPAGREGHRTEMRYLDIQFGVDIPDRIFSLSDLQRSR
jgi:outer membrane lipoprotein-sorting protein